jgi:hypothetical protein
LASCQDGVCVCAPGLELCANSCVDLQNDANNCGSCGTVCPAEQSCVSGSCAFVCPCFSTGQWKLDNLSPCFVSDGDGKLVGAVSTVQNPDGTASCPPISGLPLTAPADPFSTNTLSADCPGTYKLCYTLKAGKASSPLPSDCAFAQVCAEGYTPGGGQPMPLPALPSWVTTTPEQVACAEAFVAGGGYGEMYVEGLTEKCGAINPTSFQQVPYCPAICNQNPQDPACVNCANGGTGNF